MTERERRELAYKEEVYRLAVARREQLAELEADDGYRLPAGGEEGASRHDARLEALTARYHEPDAAGAGDGEAPWAQQEAYEAEQIKRALRAGRREEGAAARRTISSLRTRSSSSWTSTWPATRAR